MISLKQTSNAFTDKEPKQEGPTLQHCGLGNENSSQAMLDTMSSKDTQTERTNTGYGENDNVLYAGKVSSKSIESLVTVWSIPPSHSELKTRTLKYIKQRVNKSSQRT